MLHCKYRQVLTLSKHHNTGYMYYLSNINDQSKNSSSARQFLHLHLIMYSPWNVLLSHFCVRSPFAYRPFTLRSACAHRAFIIHSFAFSVHKASNVRSPFVHLSFTKRSALIQRSVFIVIRNSEVERSISRSWNEVMIKR